MDCEYFLDTDRLHDHADLIRRQKRTAQTLHDELVSARAMSAPQFSAKYNALIRKASDLVSYFDALSRVMDNTGDEAERVILEISRMLEDARFDPSAVIQID